MRVLLTCIQGYGHLHPLLPLARALQEAGHEVAFSSSERFCPRIEQAGFRAFPAGPDLAEVHEEALRRPEAATRGPDDPWHFGALLFAGVAGPAKALPLAEVIHDWHADLVVHDATDFAGPLAATRAGVPYACHSFGALLPEEFWEHGAQLVAPAWRRWDLEPNPLGGMFRYLYLDICPPSFQAPHADRLDVAHPVRPVPFDTTVIPALPGWADTLPARPTVYVTLGTIDNHAPGVFETVLEGLRDERMNVIVTVGHTRDPAELGPQPENVHVERYIPQSLLFPRCDAVVAHGGSGTTLSALAAGLPMLLLPQGANQFWNAARCVELGVGSQLLADQLDFAAVRREVATLLDDPTYRSRARAVQHEIEQMPGPEVAVGLLERLARKRPTTTPTAAAGTPAAPEEEAPAPEAPPSGGDGDEVIRARGLTTVYRSPSARGAGSPRSTTSTWPCAAERSSDSSGRAGRARRPPWACSPPG
jgi:UDP:flavonoid glycosyltransferase YjiC (YdhE family)